VLSTITLKGVVIALVHSNTDRVSQFLASFLRMSILRKLDI
jgi:hypothetical protein